VERRQVAGLFFETARRAVGRTSWQKALTISLSRFWLCLCARSLYLARPQEKGAVQTLFYQPRPRPAHSLDPLLASSFLSPCRRRCYYCYCALSLIFTSSRRRARSFYAYKAVATLSIFFCHFTFRLLWLRLLCCTATPKSSARNFTLIHRAVSVTKAGRLW
jgi:hypothetical protein